MEASLVAVPADPLARIATVKSIRTVDDIRDLFHSTGLSGRQAKAAAGAAWKGHQRTTRRGRSRRRAGRAPGGIRQAARLQLRRTNMDMTKWVEGVEKKIADASDGVSEKLSEFARGLEFSLDQKLANMRIHAGRSDAPRTMGSEFIESKAADLTALAEGGRGRVAMSTKATITSGASSGGALIEPHRDGNNALPRRRLTIRQLMNVVQISSGSVEYPEQTTRTNNADTVAEGALKPESAYAWELKNTPVRTIAHWVPASRQVLDDAPQLRDTIDGELRYGLALKEEEQLLFGSGTGANLRGMATVASAFAAPVTLADANMIDQIGLAILQAALTDNEPDGIVVHPSDWWRIRFLKDADGKYLLGAPGANLAPQLFGLPVVPTKAMPSDKFLVGAFGAQTLYDRWDPRVEVSTEHADFFVRNMVAILCEERIALATKKPEALIFGDFGNVA
jgi:HK97 family phage major capsid protein